MKYFFSFFLFLAVGISAQVKKPIKRDPFLEPSATVTKPIVISPENKVHIINADKIIKNPEKYDGNEYLTGNVKIEHQGSILYADELIIYEAENLIKATGNTKLENSDGSVITAGEMEYDGNTQKGVARKNVVLTDPKQTIKTDILYYDRIAKIAYFNTGGTITDPQNTMYTKSATYYLETKQIDFSGDVDINSPDYTIKSANIKQNQLSKIATFFGPTTITSKKDPSNYVYTENGSYNMNTKEAFLNKNSKIFYNNKILTGETLYFNQITGFGTGKGNVKLDDPLEKRYIKGGYGEIYRNKDSAMMTQNPYAVKILTKDSLYIAAERFLSYQKLDSLQKKKSYLRAYRKARIYKSNAQGRADSLAFNETDGILHFYEKPMVWSGQKQVSGDKIELYMNTETEAIDSISILGNAFAISKVDSLNSLDEFNQVKGKRMIVKYDGKDIKEAKVIGNAQAITYVEDFDKSTNKNNRIGINIASCGIIGAYFMNQSLDIISCAIGAQDSTYPMNLISPQEKKFPDFNWNTKDRIRKWQDILVDTPNYEEIKYTPNDAEYTKVQTAISEQKAKEEAKKPKRTRK